MDNRELINIIWEARPASFPALVENMATYADVGIPNIRAGIIIFIPPSPKVLRAKSINKGNTNRRTVAMAYNLTLVKHSPILDRDSRIPTTSMAKGEVACPNMDILVFMGSGMLVEDINRIKPITIASIPGLSSMFFMKSFPGPLLELLPIVNTP